MCLSVRWLIFPVASRLYAQCHAMQLWAFPVWVQFWYRICMIIPWDFEVSHFVLPRSIMQSFQRPSHVIDVRLCLTLFLGAHVHNGSIYGSESISCITHLWALVSAIIKPTKTFLRINKFARLQEGHFVYEKFSYKLLGIRFCADAMCFSLK